MMIYFADASFLVSFFSTDEHTRKARRWWEANRPIMHRSFGAMDILHVASALDMKAACVLLFDMRQRELAEAEGLKTAPA